MLNTILDENIRLMEQAFADCGDYVSRTFYANGARLYIAYLDMMTNRDMIDITVIGRLMGADPFNPGWTYQQLQEGGIPTADLKECNDLNAITDSLLTGDTALFMEGADSALVISTKGFPNRGVATAETEVVVHGSKEAFSEVFRINTALIRRRIRDTRLKIKQTTVGRRSQTSVALLYMDDIVRPAVLQAVAARIAQIDIDALADSGVLEQLIEANWLSPFPQAQLTERPDKAAASILEGRIVIVVDNAPFVLIVPVTLNAFFQASEDYYDRWQMMSLIRLIRYASALMAVALPGFYLAVALYHPSMIPLLMITKLAAARQAVPFPAVVEVLLMDAAFELLREAGIRLPGAAGGTIGIVGGLIIGQAAVEAGLVSPIVVIIIALTGIASFAIPHTSLTNGFRIVKYGVLLASAVLGLLGFWVGMLAALIHLASLTSFGVPYLLPFAAGEINGYTDIKDSIVRAPLFTLTRRPFFANPHQTRRMNRTVQCDENRTVKCEENRSVQCDENRTVKRDENRSVQCDENRPTIW